MKNKRGISPVIATVLIILITVAAIAALYSIVVPFVREGLERSSECLDYREIYSFEESGYNCYDDKNTTMLYAFSIKTKFSEELAEGSDSFRIVLIREDSTSEQLEVKNGGAEENLIVMGEPEGVLRVPGPGNIITYVYDDPDKFESAEIYPVLLSGRICGNEKDSIELRQCGEDKIIN